MSGAPMAVRQVQVQHVRDEQRRNAWRFSREQFDLLAVSSEDAHVKCATGVSLRSDLPVSCCLSWPRWWTNSYSRNDALAGGGKKLGTFTLLFFVKSSYDPCRNIEMTRSIMHKLRCVSCMP